MSDAHKQEQQNEAIAHRFHIDIFQNGDLSADGSDSRNKFYLEKSDCP